MSKEFCISKYELKRLKEINEEIKEEKDLERVDWLDERKYWIMYGIYESKIEWLVKELGKKLLDFDGEVEEGYWMYEDDEGVFGMIKKVVDRLWCESR